MMAISMKQLGPMKAAVQARWREAGSRAKNVRRCLTRPGRIGLDVGSQWVKAAQFSKVGAQTRLTACAAFPRITPGSSATAAELNQIGSILRRQGFVGRDVIIPAPGDKLQSGILELPA